MQEEKKPWSFGKVAVSILTALFGGVGGTALYFQVQRGCDMHDAHVKETLPVQAFPPRPTDDGKTGLPYRNPASRKYQVHAATFTPMPEPQRMGAGAAASRYTVRFEPRHFNAERKRYERRIDDFVFDADEAGMVEVEVVMPGEPRSIYGKLTLWYGDKGTTPLEFSPTWFKTIEEKSKAPETEEVPTDSEKIQPPSSEPSPAQPRRRRGRR